MRTCQKQFWKMQLHFPPTWSCEDLSIHVVRAIFFLHNIGFQAVDSQRTELILPFSNACRALTFPRRGSKGRPGHPWTTIAGDAPTLSRFNRFCPKILKLIWSEFCLPEIYQYFISSILHQIPLLVSLLTEPIMARFVYHIRSSKVYHFLPEHKLLPYNNTPVKKTGMLSS